MSTALVVCTGQSNERGTGGSGTASLSEAGPPHRDPIYPNGYESSMWPALVDTLAVAGIRAIVRNTAVGSSSISKGWCGLCRTWAATRKTARGEWVIPTVPNGYKYRSTGSADVNAGSSEPTWPTIVSNTVSDGSVTWTCALADANDASGHSYVEGEAGFDPMGYFNIVAQNSIGSFDLKIAIIQIGQSDALCLTTKDEFLNGYIAAANWYLSRGFKVFMGLSTGHTAYTSAYTNNFQPAITEALGFFNSNANVFRGADLFAAFGESPPYSDGGVHVTQDILRQAGDLWGGIISAALA
jgi:hypothetical protein